MWRLISRRHVPLVHRPSVLVQPLVRFNVSTLRSFSSGAARSTFTQEEIKNRSANSNLVRLVSAYQKYGHLAADIDPLGRTPRVRMAELDPAQYGLDPSSSSSVSLQGILNAGKTSSATVADVIKQLDTMYCNKVGAQISHIEDEAEIKWLAQRLEALPRDGLSKEDRVNTFNLITRSEAFDHFMQKRFTAVKRYGLEGNESMMPALDAIFKSSSAHGTEEVVLGMPHRGRLNLLVGMLNYRARDLLWKVKGNSELPSGILGIGDVLSHIGQSTDLPLGGKKDLHVTLLQNPSHLEAVDPVVLGKTRAKQETHRESHQDRHDGSLCVMLHGDAAMTGQGVVTETLALSRLPGFTTGGTIHLIVNNQIGFTTTPVNGRSTKYSGDVGKLISAPIIHVNSDSPEDVVKVCRLAADYRHQFKKDIIIDLIGYRRHGHNEVDEPAFTQPGMYTNIRAKQTIATVYGKALEAEGVIPAGEKERVAQAEHARLDEEMKHTLSAETYKYPPVDQLQGKWADMRQVPLVPSSPDTGLQAEALKEIGLASVKYPESVDVHQRLQRTHCQARRERLDKGTGLDWATAEALAVGSLLKENFNVRISGQDVGRGTFSQRHYELHSANNEKPYLPFNNMGAGGRLEMVNSNLSEFAVLGFEYGYSLEDPRNLVIWEAQFGDFANGAQIIIDQFLCSGEAKWLRQSGMVMLLPHGYDGAGPEHSSSRIERFLQLCDGPDLSCSSTTLPTHFNNTGLTPSTGNMNPNMYVINPSTPANYYHALRRQMHRNFRKPLVVISPKLILRHPTAVSSLAEMAPGTSFQPVIGDAVADQNPAQITRVVFCSGKIYYDLFEERKKAGEAGSNTALIRLEELSPFPYDLVQKEMHKYTNASRFDWVQEEQHNAGAWFYVEPRINYLLQSSSHKINYIGRPPLAACAIGVGSWHKKEVELLTKSFFKA